MGVIRIKIGSSRMVDTSELIPMDGTISATESLISRINWAARSWFEETEQAYKDAYTRVQENPDSERAEEVLDALESLRDNFSLLLGRDWGGDWLGADIDALKGVKREDD